MTNEDRGRWLAQLRVRLADVVDEAPTQLPPLADFPQFGADRKRRFIAVITNTTELQSKEPFDLASSRSGLEPLVRSGFILEQAFTTPNAYPRRGFLTVRAESRDEVQAVLSSRLPLSELEIHEIGFDQP